MPPKQASAPYAVDERVFCFHMDMLYEARILDVQQASAATGEKGSSSSSSAAAAAANPENRWRYRIHYKGWKNTWDDWVPQDRVRKFNDENRELASQLRDQARQLQQQKNAKPSGKKTGGPGSEYGPGGPFGPGGPTGDRLGAGGPGGSGGAGSGTGTATPGERGHHLHHNPLHHHLDRHHDLSTSARGSEERTGGGASASHARGPRRQRDYELEHVSTELAMFDFFVICFATACFAVTIFFTFALALFDFAAPSALSSCLVEGYVKRWAYQYSNQGMRQGDLAQYASPYMASAHCNDVALPKRSSPSMEATCSLWLGVYPSLGKDHFMCANGHVLRLPFLCMAVT